MKRLPFLLLLCPLLLSATPLYYESNMLAQKGKAISSPSESGYVLSEDGKEQTLVLDGVLVSTLTHSRRQKTRVSDYGKEKWEYDGDGNCVSYTVEIPNAAKEKWEYTYTDGLLVKAVHLVGEETAETIGYFHDGKGRLVGLSSMKNAESDYAYFGSDWSSFTNSDSVVVVKQYPQGIIIKDVFLDGDSSAHESHLDDGGNLVLVSMEGSEKVRRTFNRRGDEIAVDYLTSGKKVRRLFASSVIVREETIQGLESQVTEYTDGMKTKSELYHDGVLSSERFYPVGGSMYEIGYRDGKPLVKVTYGPDGVKVLSLEML